MSSPINNINENNINEISQKTIESILNKNEGFLYPPDSTPSTKKKVTEAKNNSFSKIVAFYRSLVDVIERPMVRKFASGDLSRSVVSRIAKIIAAVLIATPSFLVGYAIGALTENIKLSLLSKKH